MGIVRRSLEQREFSNILMRTCPQKLQLIKANQYNCTAGSCFQNGRGSISALCTVCNGTGYIGGTQSGGAAQTPPFSASPYATMYLIYGDIQQGHGLYGSGGNFVKLLADIGKIDVGDATLFTKVFDFDHATGEIVFPVIDASNSRPDRIISTSGIDYNIIKEILIEVGNNQICRCFSLEENEFSSTSTR